MPSPLCKICSCNTRVIKDTKSNIQYYACNSCDFIFIDDSHLLSADEEKSRYRQHDNTLENQGYVNMLKEFVQKSVAPFKDSVKSVLDFGCGESPVLAALLKEERFEVDTYDKFFFPEETYMGKTYDLITATEVIEHLNNPLDTFKLFKNLLNKNGIISIMTLFHARNDAQFLEWWYRRDRTHISFYSPDTISYLAKTLGMKLLQCDDKNICVLQSL